MPVVAIVLIWFGGVMVGWGICGKVMSQNNKVENCHVIQQPPNAPDKPTGQAK